MANSFSGRVWKLDTVGATSAVNSPVYINRMEWLPGAAGNVLLVKDRDSNIIWETTALTGTVAGDKVWDNPDPGMPFSGFYLTTMTAGTLYVTVG